VITLSTISRSIVLKNIPLSENVCGIGFGEWPPFGIVDKHGCLDPLERIII
jgi:hypothetical protein